jgi:acyl dehydratase
MNAPAADSAIPELRVEISRADLVRYAGAADDYVAQHWDHPFMIESGFPDVAVHGWLTFAHMCRAVTDWLPPSRWSIGGYSVRYLLPTYPGTLVCGGSVVESGSDLLTLALWAQNADGATTTRASMTVRPNR